VPFDRIARLFAQMPVPVRQQRAQSRTSLPPGPRDEQCAQGFLQLVACQGRQRVRPAPRHIQYGRKIDVTKAMPEAQLNDLALAGLKPGQDVADQCP
jgi:hypothetical protein